jgi:hypothetical protein
MLRIKFKMNNQYIQLKTAELKFYHWRNVAVRCYYYSWNFKSRVPLPQSGWLWTVVVMCKHKYDYLLTESFICLLFFVLSSTRNQHLMMLSFSENVYTNFIILLIFIIRHQLLFKPWIGINDYLEDPCVDGRVILKWILKWDGRMDWTMWLRTGRDDGLFWMW